MVPVGVVVVAAVVVLVEVVVVIIILMLMTSIITEIIPIRITTTTTTSTMMKWKIGYRTQAVGAIRGNTTVLTYPYLSGKYGTAYLAVSVCIYSYT